MASYKMNRINEDMRRELSAIIPKLKDPRITGMLSVVSVDVTNDLAVAKIYISSLDGAESLSQSIKGLTAAGGFIRRELASALSLRKMPELRFIADTGIQRSAEIQRFFDGQKDDEHVDN